MGVQASERLPEGHPAPAVHRWWRSLFRSQRNAVAHNAATSGTAVVNVGDIHRWPPSTERIMNDTCAFSQGTEAVKV
jgi:hypothetical protein